MNIAIANPFRFAGVRYEVSVGLYHLRVRDYSPKLGRFLQADPIGYQAGMNIYAYVNNDPVNYIDPFGLSPYSATELGYASQDTLVGSSGGDRLARKLRPGARWDAFPCQLSSVGITPCGPGGGGGGGRGGGARGSGSSNSGARGVPQGLGNQSPLYKSAVQPYKNSGLTNAGRGLTKHPEVIGQTKKTLRQGLRTDAAINDAAHAALRDILRNGVTTTSTLGRFGTVTQVQIPGGFGARWGPAGNFIGFINP